MGASASQLCSSPTMAPSGYEGSCLYSPLLRFRLSSPVKETSEIWPSLFYSAPEPKTHLLSPLLEREGIGGEVLKRYYSDQGIKDSQHTQEKRRPPIMGEKSAIDSANLASHPMLPKYKNRKKNPPHPVKR